MNGIDLDQILDALADRVAARLAATIASPTPGKLLSIRQAGERIGRHDPACVEPEAGITMNDQNGEKPPNDGSALHGVTRTCRCGKPSDGWPDGKRGELCQDCWESDCSDSWWRMVCGEVPRG